MSDPWPSVLNEGDSASISKAPQKGSLIVPFKVREMIKIIEADGWYLATIAGSHRQHKHFLKPEPSDNSWQARR